VEWTPEREEERRHRSGRKAQAGHRSRRTAIAACLHARLF
jgi:hypothetical protein